MHFYASSEVQNLYLIKNVGSDCYLYFDLVKGFGCDTGYDHPTLSGTTYYYFKMKFVMDGFNMRLQIYLTEEYVFIDPATE